MHNSLVLSKGLLYINTTPKGEAEGVLAFLIPTSQHTVALNGVHHDAGHQGQQRMLALAQECFWWPMMAEDCKALLQGCSRCCTFEGVVRKAPLCPIRVQAPLKLVHVDFTSIESTMKLNKPPSVKNVLVITDHFTCYALVIVTKDQMAKTVARVLYERFIVVFGMPAKLLSNWGGGGANFTSLLVKRVVCHVWHPEMPDHCIPNTMQWASEHFHQMLFRMIGKLGSDKKVQWEQHLPELLRCITVLDQW